MTEQNIATAKSRLKFLKTQINKHNNLYHNKANPEISDGEYDVLFQELLSIEGNYPKLVVADSPSQNVGATSSDVSADKTWQHTSPMLSLGNVFNFAELTHFHKRISKELNEATINYSCEPKIDGLAVSIIYVNDKLVVGATRGDGTYGEQVTQSINKITDIPQSINSGLARVEVRGEVYMKKSEFSNLKNLPADQQHNYSNPRNAAAGQLRMLKGSSCNLNFIAYNLLAENTELANISQTDSYQLLKKWGIATHPYSWLATSIEECEEYYQNLLDLKESLDFEIDGMVIKTDNKKQQEQLGQLSRQPRWATAYKFPDQSVVSQIKSVQHQVGRTGVVTPVVYLTPVVINGVTIKHATLHNYEEIKRLDVQIGDFIYIKRSGDVIPKVLGRNYGKKVAERFPITSPTVCPSCGNKLQIVKDGVYIYCLNHKNCKSQKLAKFAHFCSKRAMNIKGLGFSILKQLLNSGNLNNFTDIYKLNKDNLTALDKVADKSATNLLTSIENSKKTSLARLIYALGIKGIGETLAGNLATHFNNLDALLNATTEDLLAIDDLGETLTYSMLDYFADSDYMQDLESLIAFLDIKKIPLNLTSKNTSKTFVLTGALSKSRDFYAQQLKSQGAHVANSISKKTDYLVVGENAGSKLLKAQKLAIKILQEHELIEMIK